MNPARLLATSTKINDLRLYRRRYLYARAEAVASVGVALIVADHVMHESLHAPGSPVRIGGGECEVSLALPGGGPSGRFTLVHWVDGRAWLRLPPWAHVVTYVGKRRYERPVTQDPRVVRVPFDEQVRAELRLGPMHLLVHYSERPAISTERRSSPERSAAYGAWVLAVGLHAIAALILMLFPPETITLADPTARPLDPSDRLIGSASEGGDGVLASITPDNGGIGTKADSPMGQSATPERSGTLPYSHVRDEPAASSEEASQRRSGESVGRREGPESEDVRTRGILAVLDGAGADVLGLPVESRGLSAVEPEFGTAGLLSFRGSAGLATDRVASPLNAPMNGRSSARRGELLAVLAASREQLGSSGAAVGGTGAALAVSLEANEPVEPSVNWFEATARAQYPREYIQRVVRLRIRELRSCYESELRGGPLRTGDLVLEWVIAPDGQVTGVEIVSSDFGSDEFDRCLMDRVSRWRFRAPQEGSVRVVYPFTFYPSEA